MIDLTDIPILNRQTINTIILQAKGDNLLVYEIFESFVFEVQNMINQINEAVSILDYKQLKFLTHTIKGLSATIGAMQLHVVAKQIDLLLKEDKPLEAISYIPFMAKVYNDCQKLVKEEFKIM